MNREIYHLLRRGMGSERLNENLQRGRPRRRLPEVHWNIESRAIARRILDRCVVDGKLGVIRSGMDCDCTQYHSERVVDAPSGAVEFVRDEQRHEEWLDGPESTRFVRPDEVEPQYKSADRALEAYEDGHPHIVRYGAL